MPGSPLTRWLGFGRPQRGGKLKSPLDAEPWSFLALNSAYPFLKYLVRITMVWPSILPSICSKLSATRRMFLTTVPSLALIEEPFTSSVLVSTTQAIEQAPGNHLHGRHLAPHAIVQAGPVGAVQFFFFGELPGAFVAYPEAFVCLPVGVRGHFIHRQVVGCFAQFAGMATAGHQGFF
jgi:hypothetical protein